MKKLISILVLGLFILAAQAQTNFGYTYIGQRYEWLGGLFKALGIPAGDTPDFANGQHRRAGQLFYDSTGVDSGLYVWSGLSWNQITGGGGGTTYYPGEGIAMSNDSLHLGGLIASPAYFQNERVVSTNRKIMHWTNGVLPTSGGPSFLINSPTNINWSPYQFISSDTVTANDLAVPSVDVPLAGVYASRQIYYADNIIRNQKMFGHQFQTQWNWKDSISLDTRGGDYNVPFKIESNYIPRGTGRQGIRASHGTGQNNSRYYAAPALLVNTRISNSGTNYVKVNGHLSGVNSYLVLGETNADTVAKFIYYTTGGFLSATSNVGISYDFAPASYFAPPQIDSAYGWFDSSRVKRWGFAGKSVLGPWGGTSHNWSSSDVLKVIGNVNITDSVKIGKATAQTDTTGMDIVLRKRTDGSLFSIRADLLGVGTVHGIDDVLAVNQALTADRAIPTSPYYMGITSSSATQSFGIENTGGPFATALVVSAVGTGGRGAYINGLLYAAQLSSTNIPLRLDMDRAATANGIEINRTYSLGNGVNGMVGNVYEHNMENNGGASVPANVIQTTLDIATAGSEESSIQIKQLKAGALESGLDIQKNGVVRTNNNADTLATKAYARTLIAGGAPALTQYRLAVGDASNLLSTGAAITGSRALVSDANGVPTHATTTTAQINYLSTATSNIQDQINANNLGTKRVFWTSPAATTTITTVGTNAATSSGTLSTPALASTNLLTSTRRTSYSSGASAGSVARVNFTTLEIWRGNAASLGGFTFVARFGLNTTVTGVRAFVGVIDNVTPPTNLDLTTNTATARVGMTINASTGNWQFATNTSGVAPTLTDLGANFAVNTTDLLELKMVALPNAGTYTYTVTNLSTGSISGPTTVSSNLPASTSFLTGLTWITNNAQASAAIIDLAKMYIETNY